MRCLTTRTAMWAAGLALSALLVAGPSWSQGGGKGPGAKVEVGPSGAPSAAPAVPAASPSAAPATKPVAATKRPTPRNPFVVPGSNQPAPPVPGPKGPSQPIVVGDKTVKPTPPTPPVPPPTFTLAGIVQSNGYLKAMLVVGSKDVATVKVGDKIQGYRVSSIDLTSRQVTVMMRNTAFRVKLPRETPYGTAKADAPSKGSGGPPQGAPLPPPPAPAPAGPGK